MPGKPLDNEFRYLQQEAKELRAAFAAVRQTLAGVSAGGAAGSVAPKAPKAGGGKAEKSPFEEWAKDAKELVKTVGEVQRAARQGGGIARAMGLDEVARKLDVTANKLETVKAATEGLGAALKLARGAFLPVAVAAAAVVGPLLLVQKVFEGASGKALTLTESIQVMGLSLAKLVAETGGDVAGFLGFDPKKFEDATISAQALQEQINEIVAQAKDPGAAGTGTLDMLGGFLTDVLKQLQLVIDLVPEADTALGKLVTDDKFQRGREAIAGLRLELAGIAGDQAAIPRLAGAELEASLIPLLKEANALADALWNGGQVATGAQERLDQLNEEIRLRRELLGAQLEAETLGGRLTTYFQQASDASVATFDVITQGTQALAAGISGALLDAFLNPQKDIRESFAQLFAQLAQMILQTITQLLIAKAIASTIGGVGGGVGAAAGGPADRMAGNRPSLAHAFARGYARGGRPAGLPASDTIAAWLSPGEFILPTRSARKLTSRSLEALRVGAIDAGALDVLAAGGPAVRAPSMPRASYAEGGSVAAGDGVATGASAGVVQVAPSEQNLARLLTGGEGALVRHFRENASSLKSALGVR